MKFNGPGRYDAECTVARQATGGSVILMVVGGVRGSGFDVQVTADVLLTLPELLREIATQVERQMKES